MAQEKLITLENLSTFKDCLDNEGYIKQETDPTVPSWAKAETKPTYTKEEVGLGNVGNFKAVSTVANQGLTDAEKIAARDNIGAAPSNLVHIDTTAHWNAQRDLIGLAGHIYIYTDHDVINNVNIPAMKIGDGLAYLIDAPFVDSNEKALLDHIADTTVHITAQERSNWNNKVTCFISQSDSENIVFSKE